MDDTKKTVISCHKESNWEGLNHLDEPATIVTLAFDPGQSVTIHGTEAGEVQNDSNHAEMTTETPIYEVIADDEAQAGSLSEDDSGVGSDITSQSTSVSSSLFEPIEENGRRYHVYHAGNYLLPDDEAELERLDALNYIWKELTLGGNLHLAPVRQDAQVIMDMGAGSGIWAVDIANSIPSATVFGIDLSPVQPIFIPRNLKFYVDDLEAPWIDIDKFDFVFARDSTLCFKKPYFVLESAFQSLKRGGYIEYQNIHLPFHCPGDTLQGTAFKEWMDLISKGAEKLSRNWHVASECRANMEQVGLVDIQTKEYQWPIGTWPEGECDKWLGRWVYMTLVELKGLYAISARVLTKGMKMGIREVDDLIERVEWELKHNMNSISIPVTVLYGRKPT